MKMTDLDYDATKKTGRKIAIYLLVSSISAFFALTMSLIYFSIRFSAIAEKTTVEQSLNALAFFGSVVVAPLVEQLVIGAIFFLLSFIKPLSASWSTATLFAVSFGAIHSTTRDPVAGALIGMCAIPSFYCWLSMYSFSPKVFLRWSWFMHSTYNFIVLGAAALLSVAPTKALLT